tara:strand:+ start:14082 stop:14567 length:486 start_codon:yes stop_codon:yes gene_type:complete
MAVLIKTRGIRRKGSENSRHDILINGKIARAKVNGKTMENVFNYIYGNTFATDPFTIEDFSRNVRKTTRISPKYRVSVTLAYRLKLDKENPKMNPRRISSDLVLTVERYRPEVTLAYRLEWDEDGGRPELTFEQEQASRHNFPTKSNPRGFIAELEDEVLS